MKQPKFMSLLESAVNIIVGLGVAMIANAIILPLVGFDVSLKQNVIIAAFMTVVSLIRSYGLRRLFEALHIRIPISAFMAAVIAERQRQQDVEGWDHAHDDAHPAGELADAGAAYAHNASLFHDEPDGFPGPKYPPNLWPWSRHWWKPQGFRRDLVKGTALIVAEGERFDRTKSLKRKPVVTDDAGSNRSARIDRESDSSPALQQGGKG